MLHCHNGDIGLSVHVACMDSLAQFCWVFKVDALSSSQSLSDFDSQCRAIFFVPGMCIVYKNILYIQVHLLSYILFSFE
jgi:hypothetical protein